MRLTSHIIIGLGIMLATISSRAEPTMPSSPHGLTGSDIKKLLPLFDDFEVVGLSEFDPRDNAAHITLATRVHAPRDTLLDIFRDPANFYYISTLFKENNRLDAHQNLYTWTWASRHSFISVTGKNSIVLYPPSRVDVTIEDSSLGKGTFIIRFFDETPKHTIMTISGLLHVTSSEWLVRVLVGQSPAMKQAMNIAIGVVVLNGTRHLAQRLAKNLPPRPRKLKKTQETTPDPLSPRDLTLLAPLVNRGQVFLCQSAPNGRLKQATIVDAIHASVDQLTQAVSTPTNYQKHMGSIHGIEIHETTNDATSFSWKLGFSIFGLHSRNVLTPIEHGVLLSAVAGDLSGARWRWQFSPRTEQSTTVAYHAWVDVRRASAILGTTIRREPYLEHGLVMGSNIVMLNAMRKTVETTPGRQTRITATKRSVSSK